ncbi:alpha/beta hydrolase [Halobacteriales archaeon QS_4_70_19]|nr:MAG: alpha/beta hydrolase [Halobacteriales archaeon QS_4_70_19]
MDVVTDRESRGTVRETTVETGDGRGNPRETDIRYRVAGPADAPPVVLLHGIGLDAADVSFRYLLSDLAADRRVYAPDLPGHGGSEKPRLSYTTAFFRRALAAFLDDRGLDGPSLVGVSMGGAVALGYALDHPVERLVLANSYGLGADAPWRPAAATMLRTPFAHRAWWAGVSSSRTAVREHLRTMTSGTPPDDLVRDVYRAIGPAAVGRTVASWQRDEFRADGLRTDYSARLDALEPEALFVHGEQDPLLPASWSVEAAERTDSALAVFGDCGHWTPREAPERFSECVRSFLADA